MRLSFATSEVTALNQDGDDVVRVVSDDGDPVYLLARARMWLANLNPVLNTRTGSRYSCSVARTVVVVRVGRFLRICRLRSPFLTFERQRGFL